MTPVPPELPIQPVLILSTGRCGSTLVSEMLNRHPGVLSVSEFFSTLGAAAFAWSRPDGARMWKIYSRQSAAVNAMLRDGEIVSEVLYEHDQARSRFQAWNMPPILSITLPHLTDQPEVLYDVPALLKRYPLELADFAAFWSDMILLGEQVLAPLPASRRLNIKFEDVQEKPRETLSTMIRFIDPSLESATWLDDAGTMLRPTRSRFSKLSETEQAAVTTACLPGLRALGYVP